MGWCESVAFSHAQRLERQGWLARYPTVVGDGSLLVATRVGVGVTGVHVPPAPAPAPTWWAHLRACAWAAAWLTARGRELQGAREVEVDESWAGEVHWRDGHGQRRAGHRPDLAWLAPGGRVAIEVELTRKSTARLRGILELHSRWRAEGRSGGVIYICANERTRERVIRLASEQELRTGKGGGLRVELVEAVRQQAIQAAISEASSIARESGVRLSVREDGGQIELGDRRC